MLLLNSLSEVASVLALLPLMLVLAKVAYGGAQ